jgi:hypothetical protein
MTVLVVWVAGALRAPIAKPGGRPCALGLFGSVALVVHLMRRNPAQDAAGAVFGVSQPTVSRRWDLLRPVIGRVLRGFVPGAGDLVGTFGTVIVDGTVCPTWDWRHIPDLYSTKAGYAGMNVQVAATLDGRVAAVGPRAVHGARHDAHAYAASGLADLVTGLHQIADLGYVGVQGIDLVPYKRLPGQELSEHDAAFNRAFSSIRAAGEHANARLKTWRMLSEEGGRYRAPLDKFDEMLTAITALHNYRISTDEHGAFE